MKKLLLLLFIISGLTVGLVTPAAASGPRECLPSEGCTVVGDPLPEAPVPLTEPAASQNEPAATANAAPPSTSTRRNVPPNNTATGTTSNLTPEAGAEQVSSVVPVAAAAAQPATEAGSTPAQTPAGQPWIPLSLAAAILGIMFAVHRVFGNDGIGGFKIKRWENGFSSEAD